MRVVFLTFWGQTIMSMESHGEHEAFDQWLDSVGLKGNPFRDYSARGDIDLTTYFVGLPQLSLRELLEDPQPWVIFGERGSGKTSLRMMVADHCYPHDRDSSVFCIGCGSSELGKVLWEASDGSLASTHWIEALAGMARQMIPKGQDKESEYISPFSAGREIFLAYAWEDRPFADELAEAFQAHNIPVWYDRNIHRGQDWIREVERHIKGACAIVVVLSRQSLSSEWIEREVLFAIMHEIPVIPYLLEKVDLPLWAMGSQLAQNKQDLIASLKRFIRPRKLQDRESLSALVSMAKSAGFQRMLCLIDEVDEVPQLQERPGAIIQVVTSLMSLERHKVPGIAFRYFLPVSLRTALLRQRDIRLDRYRVEYLRWRPSDLKRLIRQRLIAFSKSRTSPYGSLGQLCSPANGFAARIDDDLTKQAEGNPRAVVYLADRLLRLHCRSNDASRLIQPSTWEEVKEEWTQQGRDRLLGPLPYGFRLLWDRVFFRDQEIVLSSKYNALLRHLVKARGRTCSVAELAQVGWPEADPAYVNSRMVGETMRRLRKMLEGWGVPRDCIETVRARGYRLRSFPDCQKKGDRSSTN